MLIVRDMCRLLEQKINFESRRSSPFEIFIIFLGLMKIIVY